ncbi:hypothetical protein O181_073879 [Austropuccinia psidii MF-1]|uniref:Uncharacterized protein n=1 Tax=Austropuccinia psidii MF-1 TaxID=1389203 RepID=A0A9Q3F7L0_9BASI|nr:hypothetical protein [Austropuccinia psidii MF-1]
MFINCPALRSTGSWRRPPLAKVPTLQPLVIAWAILFMLSSPTIQDSNTGPCLKFYENHLMRASLSGDNDETLKDAISSKEVYLQLCTNLVDLLPKDAWGFVPPLLALSSQEAMKDVLGITSSLKKSKAQAETPTDHLKEMKGTNATTPEPNSENIALASNQTNATLQMERGVPSQATALQKNPTVLMAGTSVCTQLNLSNFSPLWKINLEWDHSASYSKFEAFRLKKLVWLAGISSVFHFSISFIAS